jgi:uncharacterized protein YjbJ (UPF0337 family)
MYPPLTRKHDLTQRTRSKGDCPMNWNQIEGKWKQLKGSAKARWGELTDSDFDLINGRREQLVGLIQERYGIAKDEAETQVNDWAASTQERAPERKAG